MGWLKRRLPKRRWARVAVCAASTVAILAALDMAWVQHLRTVVISPETTRITAPLNADGMPDYLAAMNAKYGAGVTPENNAAPLMLMLTGTQGISAWWREHVFPELGLSAAEVPNRYQSYWQWMHARPTRPGTTLPDERKIEEDENAMPNAPWKRAEHRDWAQWLDSQREILEGARRAAERPRCFVPLVSPKQGVEAMVWGSIATDRNFIDPDLAICSVVRATRDLLATHAMAAAGDGDMDIVERDIIAQMKWARLIGQRPLLIDDFVSVALEAMACQQVSDMAVRSGVWDPAAARHMLAAMDALPPLPWPQAALDEEARYSLLNGLLLGAVKGAARMDHTFKLTRLVSDRTPLPTVTWTQQLESLFIPVNYNSELKSVNALQDRITAALRKPTFREKLAAADALDKELEPYANAPSLITSRRPAFSLMALYWRGISKVFVLDQRTRTQQDLARVALALVIYHGEQGAYPEKLETLKELGILRDVPLDGFSNQPLIYWREGQGYVVYSIGEDLKDDGGLPPEKQKTHMQDIVVRAER